MVGLKPLAASLERSRNLGDVRVYVEILWAAQVLPALLSPLTNLMCVGHSYCEIITIKLQ